MAVNRAREYTETTLKRLFALSGNICAHPNCSNNLIHIDGTVIAEICHIEAANEKGERYNPNMTDDERRDFNNLILLCSNCHKITNNVILYTVENLQKIKADHERIYQKNGYNPDAKMYDKILARFAYDISFTEQEEWGILEEIIKFVNENAPKINPSPQQIMEGENFLHISEKVKLNFPKEQRGQFQSTYISTNAKQQTTAKFLAKIASEDSVEVDELREYIASKYRELKNVSVEDVPIDDMKVIDDLAYQIIPASKRNSPGYHATAKAVILQSFEYCHIGQKTDYERSQTLSLFD